MIAALVNLAPGVGRTTLAVNLAGELALQGKRVALLDVDGASGVRDWAGMRGRNDLPALFDTVTITSAQLRCGLWGLGISVDHVVIDTPARSPAAVRAALLVAETVLMPTPPDRKAVGRCAATMQLVVEALAAEPALTAALVLTQAPESVLVEPGTEAQVLGLRLPVSEAVVRRRMVFATSRNTGLLVPELEMAGRAEADVRGLVSEVFGLGSVPVAG
ncbi:chromosome partitioning protein [Azospirillum sp. BE72]|uniref:nucleotide-binding protein n=1 Tax=Azospirillum sp. BE72 TaxID=2817776 RepID=UPI00285B8316|nr:chromosome partitioning protein [Azospirillum sp. BE72]MDR6773302.1 chromosome partitioning protein [Azospirillum sp. BE72]